DGVLVCGLEEALARHRHLVEPHLARYADYENHAFTALNTAFLCDGAFVYIPAGKVVEAPIYLPYFTDAADRPLVWHRRSLIVAGAGSRARVVASYDGSEGADFANAVTKAAVAVGADPRYYPLHPR